MIVQTSANLIVNLLISKTLFCHYRCSDHNNELHIVHEIWTWIRSHWFLNDFLCNPSNCGSQSSQCSWGSQCFHRLIIRHFILTNKKKSIGFTLTGSLTGVSPEGLELTLLCLSLWFWFINESHQLFSFIVKSSQWELHLLLKEFEWVRMTMMFPSSGSNPSDCFEPPFFFFSSLTLLLYSASFLPAYLGLLVDFYGVHSKAWPFKFSTMQPSSKSLSWCFFSLRFFIPHFIC